MRKKRAAGPAIPEKRGVSDECLFLPEKLDRIREGVDWPRRRDSSGERRMGALRLRGRGPLVSLVSFVAGVDSKGVRLGGAHRF